MAGTKVERIAVGGYYANSLTNVSCNQTAIYQSINSTIESIYDRVADPLRGSTFLSFFSFPLSLFFSSISYVSRVFEVFEECLHRRPVDKKLRERWVIIQCVNGYRANCS